MKKTRTLGAMLAVAISAVSAAHAQQPPVQVYGLVDTAVEHLTNTNAAGDSVTRIPSIGGGMFPARIGFRGSEDLGKGVKAVFVLESGFAPDNGVVGQGNRLFGRQAWVGLTGDFGTVTLGRTYSMLTWSFYDLDTMGPSQFGLGNFDGYVPNSRHDNSIAYKGTFNGLTLGATYSLGRDASNAGGPAATNCAGELVNDSSACRNWSAMVRYDRPGWGVVAAYDTYNGGPGAIGAFSPTRSDLADSRLNLGGWAWIGSLKVGGGWMQRDNEANALVPKSNLAYVGGTYSLTPEIVLEAEAARLDFKNSANDSTMYVVRAVYNLSKRTAVYALAGRVSNRGTAAVPLSAGATVVAGGIQNGVLSGIKHSF